MSDDALSIGRDGPVARIALTRSAKHNAFDDALIAQLTGAFEQLGEDPAVRVIVLAAAGKSFSAGADLNYMARMAEYGREDNLTDARALGRLMHVIDACPKPTVARVQGAAIGGGVGLVACCDIAVGTARASFCLSEVKLGLIPAVIGPFVVQAIGARAARRYFLTAERFDADTAHRLGLLHEVVAEEADLDPAIDRLIAALLAGGPAAQAAAKDLIRAVAFAPPDTVAEATATRIADRRASAEGREGLAAFLEKRSPRFIEQS